MKVYNFERNFLETAKCDLSTFCQNVLHISLVLINFVVFIANHFGCFLDYNELNMHIMKNSDKR